MTVHCDTVGLLCGYLQYLGYSLGYFVSSVTGCSNQCQLCLCLVYPALLLVLPVMYDLCVLV